MTTMREAFRAWRETQPGHLMAFYDQYTAAFQAGWYAALEAAARQKFAFDNYLAKAEDRRVRGTVPEKDDGN